MTSLTKIDFKREYKAAYTAPTTQPKIIDVPEVAYLAIAGSGNPNHGTEWAAAVEALYTVSYGAKFKLKKAGIIDYTVMPLEGLWEMDGGPPLQNEDGTWGWDWEKVLWQAIIMQPKQVTSELIAEVTCEAEKKKELPAIDKLQQVTLSQGKVAQIMHIGPYDKEGPTITKLHQFIEENGYQPHLVHHEIYLSDARRTAPEKLKTILRQPIRLS